MKLEGIEVVDLSVFLPGPVSHHGARRSRRRGDQGRAAGRGRSGPPYRPVGRPEHRVLPQRQSRQEERRHRPEAPTAARRLLKLCDSADVFVEILPARRRAASRRRLRGSERAQSRASSTARSALSARTAPIATGRRTISPPMALSGALSITLGPDGAPAMPGVAVADMLSALQALSGVLMALAPPREDRAAATTSMSPCMTRCSRPAQCDRAGDGGAAASPTRSTSAPPAARPSTRSTRRATAAISSSAARR